MAKLQRFGVITPHEYKQAEQAGRFLITDSVICSYCQAPVEIGADLQFHCQRHRELELRTYDNPGYPAIENETHGTMMFFFERENVELLSISTEHRGILASYKGCPFCDRNLSGTLRNAEVAEQSWWCDECGVAFFIEFIRRVSLHGNTYEMRFQPEVKYLVGEAPAHDETELGITSDSNSVPTDVPMDHPNFSGFGNSAEMKQAHTDADAQDVEHRPTAEDLAVSFIETHLKADAEHFEVRSVIYTAYERFVEIRNQTPLEDRKLYKLLRQHYTVENARRRIDRKLQYGFVGIRCVSITDIDTDGAS